MVDTVDYLLGDYFRPFFFVIKARIQLPSKDASPFKKFDFHMIAGTSSLVQANNGGLPLPNGCSITGS